MLTSFLGFNPFNVFDYGLTGVFMFLDGIVYWVVSKLFSLYVALAGAEIISSDMYAVLVQKLEVIIGVFMLFYLAYALLKSIINPDELAKNTSKIVTNFVITIVLLGVVPIIFNYAFKLQNIIIAENKIGILLFGDETSNNDIQSIGNVAALTTLEAFLQIDDDIMGESITINDVDASWGDLKNIIKTGNSDAFMAITHWVEPVHDGNVGTSYIPIISTIAGGFLAYVLISFCIDLGIRVVKLAFFQIISPIPILMRVIPEKKSTFDNWLKETLATYFEVFVRLFVMYVVIFLVQLIINAMANGQLAFNETTGDIGVLGVVIVIMGLFAFAKQAPKLISDILGIKSGNLKLGIKDKLADGGAFMAASALGGGVTTGIRNLTHGIQNIAKAKGFGNKALAALRTVGSTGTGMISGAARGGYGARGAKTYADVKKYAGEGAAAAIKKRDERETYKASHSGPLGVTRGHIEDMYQSAVEWAGVELGTEAIKKELDVYTEGAGYKKKLEDLALKKSTKAKLYSQQIDALNQETIDRNTIKKQVEQNIRARHNVDSYRNAAMNSLNRAHYRSIEEYNAAVEHKAQLSYAAALQKDLNDNLNSETNKLYNQQMEERANQIDQLKRAKDYEVMRVVNEKLAKGEDAEFQEIVNSFKTFKKKNASYEDIVNLGDLTAAGWDSSWDTIDPMTLTKDDFDKMKKAVTYTKNHTALDDKKKEAAARYAERIQKEQEKK